MKLGNMRAAELQWRDDSRGVTQPVLVPRRPQAMRKAERWVWMFWLGYISLYVAVGLFLLHFYRGTP